MFNYSTDLTLNVKDEKKHNYKLTALQWLVLLVGSTHIIKMQYQ